ncbi:MAG: hypothetical protein ACJAX5_003131 [Patiriisocius sp.]|jgi:hypothetical protein
MVIFSMPGNNLAMARLRREARLLNFAIRVSFTSSAQHIRGIVVNFDYSSASNSVRPDLPQSYRKVWAKISESGNHRHAVDKIAIAAESRVARQCQFCHERKAALSLYALKGKH